MKINIIGAGPAGLYFAIQMMKRDPGHDITIYERSLADITWGWGVVFSSKTLGYLQRSDSVTHQRLLDKLTLWNDVIIGLDGDEIHVGGSPFSAVARIEILKILHQRCEELGVSLRFGQDIANPDSLRDCDLLVGADGVSSRVRAQWSDAFAPTLEYGSNKYIWLGTTRRFEGLTLAFTHHEGLAFAAHAYAFNDSHSTFIVECTEDNWRGAGLDERSTDDGCHYLAQAFATELRGAPLLSNRSKWINFVRVANTRWHHDNIVLLGDALHTAHFSIGSGTKLAMEDAIVLADSIAQTTSIKAALPHFETARRPAVEKLQTAAAASRAWFEDYPAKLNQSAVELAYDAMTRSGRISLDDLRAQDPAFAARYEQRTQA